MVICLRQKSYREKNALYLIPTPIGNLEDMTYRAVKTLEEVDLLLCEDTRVTGQLLKHYGLSKKLLRCDEHSEEKMKGYVLEQLSCGKKIGFTSDRGTPIISDPGYQIALAVIEAGYPVISLPGATAFVPALTMSGLAPSPFLFYGFLDSRHTRRLEELRRLERVTCTMIFYEAPHRITEMLQDIKEVFGNRKISIAREISKLYEEIYRGPLDEVMEEIKEAKGEMVIVVSGNHETVDYSQLTIFAHVTLYVADGLSEMDAMKKVAKERGVSKSQIYQEYQKAKEEKR